MMLLFTHQCLNERVRGREGCLHTRCLSLQPTLGLLFCLVSVTGSRMWRRLTLQPFVTGRFPAPDPPDWQLLVSVAADRSLITALSDTSGLNLNTCLCHMCLETCRPNVLKEQFSVLEKCFKGSLIIPLQKLYVFDRSYC